jgi:small GTP-binding protein
LKHFSIGGNMDQYQNQIRNFCIIAHIDHGKSTLADRLLETTGVVAHREMKEQFLDNMDIERERGITIKLQTTRLNYRAKDGKEYIFNLIDTPGHVDFTYEVSRSLAACEGAVLVVDATQGVEAQTVANVYLALDENLEIFPVINKIDLASADPDAAKAEIEEVLGIDASEAPLISAKEGTNIEEVLEGVIRHIPAPGGDPEGKLKALIFDSYYDNYRGVVIYTRVFDGEIKEGDLIKLMSTNKKYEVTEVGVFAPGPTPVKRLRAGEVGYICAGIKQVADARVGDTITLDNDPADAPLPGYKKMQSMVYCGIYPAEGEKYESVFESITVGTPMAITLVPRDFSVRSFLMFPVPGGGSAAALAAATVAGLISMVASLTIGKSGYEEHWEEMERIRDEMEGARNFFLDAMDEDAGSYAKVIDCFKMPKNTEEEKACRTEAIQNALYEAAVVPLRVAEKAASLFEYAGIVIEKGNRNAASDGAVAALMARAATRGALFNVRINAESLKDPQRKSELLKRAEELEKEADGAERKALERLTL